MVAFNTSHSWLSLKRCICLQSFQPNRFTTIHWLLPLGRSFQKTMHIFFAITHPLMLPMI